MRILITKKIDKKYLDILKNNNIDFLIMPQIEVRHRTFNKDTINAIYNINNEAIVFSSINGVLAFEENGLGNYIKSKKCFAVGRNTQQYLNDSGYDIIRFDVQTAKELAETITNTYNNYTFLIIKGNIGLDIITEKLSENNITNYNFIAYDTVLLKPQVEIDIFDSLVFFSPSGVDSFFSVNKLKHPIKIFAIGNTTFDRIKKHETLNSKIFVPTLYNTESLVDLIINQR